jgi:hypothetical protein
MGENGSGASPDVFLPVQMGVDSKNEGLEEETLVTSSNPISQVLW